MHQGLTVFKGTAKRNGASLRFQFDEEETFATQRVLYIEDVGRTRVI